MSGLNSRHPPHRQREWGKADKFSDNGRLEVSAMLRDDINTALNQAMKAGEARGVSTLRLVNATLKNADIEARGQGKPALTDDDVLGILQKMIKQRHESVELYEKGGRPELAAQEREEIVIISHYLPRQMTDQEIHDTIGALVKETGATAMKDMGRVMTALKERSEERRVG